MVRHKERTLHLGSENENIMCLNLIFQIFMVPRYKFLASIEFIFHLDVYLFLWRARSDASAIILQQMFWTIFYAGSSVSIFSIWISFPFIFDRIIPLHGRAFLFTDTIIVEIFASLIDRENE